MRYKIGVTTSQEYPVRVDKFLDGLIGVDASVEEIDMPFRELTEEETREIVPKLEPYEALLVRSGIFTSEILRSLPNLKVICVHGAGVDQIDCKEAAKLGIAVLNTPGANANGVIELTMALMLIQTRNLFTSIYRLKNLGDWTGGKICGKELNKKILGLFGAGRIGLEVARRAVAFGMKVKIYDPYLTNKIEMNGVEVCEELDDMLRSADIISLHAPLTEQTKYVVNKASIAKMKDGVIIINTSRGGLVNEEELYDALICHKVGAASLDVFETEPASSDNPLFKLDNVIVTPHIGGSTQESLENVAFMAGKEIKGYLNTGESKYIVNK